MRSLPFLVIVLAPLAACACGEVEAPAPAEMLVLQGTWSYSASITWASDTSVALQCEIAGLVLTMENPREIQRHRGYYEFDTQMSGGTLGCTGDGVEEFVRT